MSISGPGGNTPGTNLNRMMDSMGFPDKMGDIMGAALDARVGEGAGVARNIFDAMSGLSTGQLDKLMSGGFKPPGFCQRPHHDFRQHFHANAHKHYERESIQTFDTGNIFDRKSNVMIDGQKVDVGKMPKGMKPGEFEAKLQSDPALRSKVESQIGGRIVDDGRDDGRITVAKRHHHPCLPFQNHINQHCGNMLGRLLMPNILQNVLGNLAQALGRPGGGPGGAGGAGQAGQAGGAGGAGQAGQAGGAGGAGQAGGASGQASEILKNPNLSFEEKLFQFMLLFADKKQKEIEDKMTEMDKAKQSGQGAGGAGGAKGGGGAKGAGGAKGGGKASPLGKVGNLAGGVMQMGQGLFGGLAGGPMGAAMGNQAGGGSAAGGGGDQAGGAGGKGKSEQTLQAELQRLQSELTQMFTTVTKMQEAYDGLVKGVASSLSR